MRRKEDNLSLGKYFRDLEYLGQARIQRALRALFDRNSNRIRSSKGTQMVVPIPAGAYL